MAYIMDTNEEERVKVSFFFNLVLSLIRFYCVKCFLSFGIEACPLLKDICFTVIYLIQLA
jgi:hypothetical protein